MTIGVTRLPGLEQAAQEMPFDQFGRYHMLREAVDACRAQLGVQQLTILDVGGFYEDHGQPTLPLTRFLPADDVTVVDVVECDLPGYIKGDGTALHFDAASYDLVVSADTLEHIPQSGRAAFWRELLRVARHGVILLAPFGTPEVENAEAVLFAYIKAELHAEHQQLKEHCEYGLPRLDEWLALLEQEGATARAYPTGYLQAWLGMMMLKHLLMRVDPGVTTQRLVDSYYNRSFFPTERRAPAYRHLVIAEKTAGLVAAVDAVLSPTIMPAQDDASADWGGAFLPTLLTVVQRQLAAHQEENGQRQEENGQRQAQLEKRFLALEAQLQEQHQQQIAHYRAQISALDRLLADQQIMINQLQQQALNLQQQAVAVSEHARQRVEQYEAALRDLTERAHWLEGQTVTLRGQLETVQHGRVMRVLNALSGRK
jgi:hypothetical protein